MCVGETWAMENIGHGMDFQIPMGQIQKYTKILLNYVRNKEDGCTDRNFEAHLISGIRPSKIKYH